MLILFTNTFVYWLNFSFPFSLKIKVLNLPKRRRKVVSALALHCYKIGFNKIELYLYMRYACWSESAARCPIGWDHHGNSCYLFSKDTQSWNSSSVCCCCCFLGGRRGLDIFLLKLDNSTFLFFFQFYY